MEHDEVHVLKNHGNFTKIMKIINSNNRSSHIEILITFIIWRIVGHEFLFLLFHNCRIVNSLFTRHQINLIHFFDFRCTLKTKFLPNNASLKHQVHGGSRGMKWFIETNNNYNNWLGENSFWKQKWSKSSVLICIMKFNYDYRNSCYILDAQVDPVNRTNAYIWAISVLIIETSIHWIIRLFQLRYLIR